MRWTWLALAIVAASSAPSAAFAQARSVVIAQLDGRNSAAARRVIQQGLEERGLTVTLADSDPGDDTAATTALANGADAVIGGRAASRGRNEWRVNLWVRDAQGGEQGRVRMRRVRGARGVSRLVGRLAEALAGVPTGSSPSAPVSEPAPTATEEPGSGGGDEPAEEAEQEEAESRPAPPPAASTSSDDDEEAPLIRLWGMVGAGVRSRSVELLNPDGVDGAYRIEPYFQINGRFGARFFDVLFVRYRFGTSIALDSRREAESLGNVDTHFFDMRADIGASYWIGGDVELGAAFGIGWDRYELAFNELVPTTDYVNLRPAVVGGFRLIERYLILDAEVGVRIPLSVGDLQALHGTNYRVIGVDGVIRLRGVIAPGFTWAIEGAFRHYDLLFRRAGAFAVNGQDSGWRATGFVGWELDLAP